MKNPQWICKKFDTLTVLELYEIMKIRNEVFIVEQNCVYQDADEKDLEAFHLFYTDTKNIYAYARLLAPGVSYKNAASIGRVLTISAARKQGLGITLINEAIAKIEELYGTSEIIIGAQLYLKKFYENFGFQITSDVYLEDGIEHIEMELKK